MKRKITKEKFDNALYNALNGIHYIDLVFWNIVKPWKIEIFVQSINNGMHWEAAYQTAKKAKKNK